jgi:hypothetical protein
MDFYLKLKKNGFSSEIQTKMDFYPKSKKWIFIQNPKNGFLSKIQKMDFYPKSKKHPIF